MKAKIAIGLIGFAAVAALVGCMGIKPTKIVFVSDRDGNNEVYVMNINGGGLSRITNNGFEDIEAMISPDGEEIVFSSNRDGNYEIYVMNFDGTNVRRLTVSGNDDRQPCWNPDSNKIVWVSYQGDQNHLYQMDKDGANVIQLTTVVADNSAPFWGHGNRIYFGSNRGGNYEIWRLIAGATETGVEQITSIGGYNHFPAVSPNNEKIAFVSNDSGSFEIWIMNRDGSELTQLTDNGGPNWSPKFLSNSKAIVWQSYSGGGNFDIWRMDADGSDPVNLTSNASVNSSPSAARR
jgi:Tol biopolymer transport system component